jgi:hypothetical protein
MNQNETIQATDSASVCIERLSSLNEESKLTGYFHVECLGPDGQVKWTDTFKNQVTTVGANFMLNQTFTGSSYTAAWYLGLVTGPGAGNTYLAANTMASHAGWLESTAYSNATRPVMAFSAASAGAISTSAAVSFNINATATIAGAFVTTDNTKGGTTGTLYSAKNFTGGDRAVASGDILNVSYTTTITV